MKCYYIDVREFVDSNRFDEGYRMVSRRRREKIDRSKIEGDKRLLLGAGILETLVLAPLTGETEPEITCNEQEKPFLPEDCHLYYNISHSGNYTVMAISPQVCGVDVERLHASFRQIVKRFFTEAEQRAMAEADQAAEKAKRLETAKGEQQTMAEADQAAKRTITAGAGPQTPEDLFVQIWTRKESYLKMTGEGLSRDLRSFDVWPQAPEGCRFFEYSLEDHRICVCCPENEPGEPLEKITFGKCTLPFSEMVL